MHAGLCLVCAVSSAVFADENPFAAGNPFGGERSARQPAAPIIEPGNQTDPLETLKNRSAIERWRLRRQRWEHDSLRHNEDPVRRGNFPIPPSNRQARNLPKPQPVGNDLLELQPLPDNPLSDELLNFPLPDEPPAAERVEPPKISKELKKITDILPFYNYEPDENVRKRDPCEYLCPRPDGKPCKPLKPGQMVSECPEEIRLSDLPYQPRAFESVVFNWEASNLYHNPLYFEDAPLERYGHTHHAAVQPFVSTAKFGVQLLGLPYQMTIDPIHKRMYPLGWYRPGDFVPYKYYQIPLNKKAGLVEAGFMTGMFFLFP